MQREVADERGLRLPGCGHGWREKTNDYSAAKAAAGGMCGRFVFPMYLWRQSMRSESRDTKLSIVHTMYACFALVEATTAGAGR